MRIPRRCHPGSAYRHDWMVSRWPWYKFDPLTASENRNSAVVDSSPGLRTGSAVYFGNIVYPVIVQAIGFGILQQLTVDVLFPHTLACDQVKQVPAAGSAINSIIGHKVPGFLFFDALRFHEAYNTGL